MTEDEKDLCRMAAVRLADLQAELTERRGFAYAYDFGTENLIADLRKAAQ